MRNFSKYVVSFSGRIAAGVATFAISALLLRKMSLDDYGRFSVTMSLATFVAGAGDAFVVTPLVVSCIKRAQLEADAFSKAFWRLIFISGGTTLFVLFVGAVFLVFGYDFRFSLFMIALTGSCISLREVVSRWSIIFGSGISSAAANGIMLTSSLGAIWFIRGTLPVEGGLALVALGNAVSLASLFIRSPAVSPIEYSDIFLFQREAVDGFWNLFLHVILFFRSQAFTYITLFIATTVDVAVLSASRLFVMPLMIGIQVVGQVNYRKSRRIVEGHENKFVLIRDQVLIYLGMVGVFGAGLYFVFPVLKDFLTEKYARADAVIWLWVLYCIAVALRTVWENVFQTTGAYSEMVLINIISFAVVVAIVCVGTFFWGIRGCVISQAIGETVVAFFYYIAVEHFWSRSQTDKPVFRDMSN